MWSLSNKTGLVGRYTISDLEMSTAEDPAPELVHSFGDCFIFSTTTNGSLQEAKNSITSCLTVSLTHTYSFVEKGILLWFGKEQWQTVVSGSTVTINGLLVWCLFWWSTNPTQNILKLHYYWKQSLPLTIQHRFDLPILLNIKALKYHLKCSMHWCSKGLCNLLS